MEPLVAASIMAVVVLLLFVGIARLSAGNPDIKGRLQKFVGDDPVEKPKEKGPKKQFSLGLGGTKLAARVDKAVSDRTFGKTVQRKLAQADLKLTLSEFMLVKVFTVATGLMVGLFLGRGSAVSMVIFTLVGVAVGYFGPDIFVKQRLSKRLKEFNGQLGDTISLMANSLRSGYSLLQSMELVSREAPDPIGTEFKRVVREVGLGLSPQDALNHLLERMPSDDLDLLITAINIQYEVGGNLAQILDTISHTIRERVRIKGEIQVLTAQGRMSGYVITALPPGIGLIVTIINPTYMNTMWEFPWIIMPICGGVMVFVGYMVIRKIVNIEV
ncbi:MAG: type II secretion system F family protein [Chloroflexota bacterium]